jgi:7,8-dihydropterin-6-yl-methyl-4-(beta-D-ribofuranosyl)aminobenzene 5'-phosphate synthase
MKRITCVIDNTVRQGSACWGEHGLAFYLETDQGCVLFDTGQSGAVLQHNLTSLDKSLANVSGLVLSHAHYDHTGGLSEVLSQKPGLPLYASPDFFRPRFSLREEGYKSIGLTLTQAELTHKADLRLNEAPVEVLPGVWTTGEIHKRPEPEGRSPRHFVPAGDKWQPDPYQDDMSLVLETQEGVVVVCGCCHAGLLNTLAHTRRMFSEPIIAVLGGSHLVSADEAHLQRVIEVLRDRYDSPHLYLNHCTGIQAYVTLAHAFGERVNACPAGASLTFD